jgi:hypothetical protein
MKSYVRSLKIQPRYKFLKRKQTKVIPEIKLSGDWLKKLGFNSGERVYITAMENVLVICTEEQI